MLEMAPRFLPVRVGDLGTRPKTPTMGWFRPENRQFVLFSAVGYNASVVNMEYFYANDLFCSAPRKEQGCQGRSRRKQPADSKNCNNIPYFFTALCIEGHYRVPSLVNHVLMRLDAFRIEVIEIRWAGPLGPCHASF
jgi:hypothetical protein